MLCHLEIMAMHDYQESVATKHTDTGQSFLTLESGISAKFDVRQMLSHPKGRDKPIPEVSHLWCHRTSTPNNLEKSLLAYMSSLPL